MKNAVIGAVAASAAVLIGGQGHARSASAAVARMPTLYVRDFEAVNVEQGGDSGVLSRLHAHFDGQRADDAAANLSQAVVTALNAAHADARYLAAGAPTPPSGWIISGEFYAIHEKRPLISIPFLGSSDGPNTEIVLEITDPAVDPTKPFATVGENYRLKGQDGNFSLNPYVVSAKFVYNKLASSASIDALAKEIAARIIANEDGLRTRDTASESR